jgi:thiamine-monophosphate kinase
MKTLREIGEHSALKRIFELLPSRPDVLHGAGDDCAVVKAEGSDWDWLLTSDPVIEGTHFAGQTPPRLVGRKAVARTFSDLAAMGGEPCWTLIDTVAPPDTPAAWLEDACRGAAELAEKYHVALVGGDLSRGPVKELHAFTVGRTPSGSAVLRSGADNNDTIFVTGELGASIRGKHLSFEPRIAEGIWLHKTGWATSMIDLSDGLARDLKRLCEMSGTGAEIRLADIPASPETENIDDSRTPIDHALYDGEDFELLFTVPQNREKEFLCAWSDTFDLPCRPIGHISDNPGNLHTVDKNGNRKDMDNGDFRHFA